MALLPKSEHEGSNKVYKNFLARDKPDRMPEMVYNVIIKSGHLPPQRRPVEKTEAEIERLSEYNKMFGREEVMRNYHGVDCQVPGKLALERELVVIRRWLAVLVMFTVVELSIILCSCQGLYTKRGVNDGTRGVFRAGAV